MTSLFTQQIRKIFKRFKGKSSGEIYPDEIFLDSRNLPEFNTYQFEGRLEKPLSRQIFFFFGVVFFLIVIVFGVKLWSLQIKDGKVYAQKGEANRLDQTILFPDRGVIYDRNGVTLAWNEINPNNPDFSLRTYTELSGLSSLLGFVKYPSKDTSGFYYQQDYVGKDGVEKAFNEQLRGEAGMKLIEVDAHNTIQSESIQNEAKTGKNLTLSIDSRIQHHMYELIAELAGRVGFSGGAGVIMNVRTGEVLTKVNFPEYSSDVMTQGKDAAMIGEYLKDKRNPFLDRIVDGLYTPGSIVKPYVALGALEEGIISPEKRILSTGSLSVPNPYQPGVFTVFKDWKAHGWVSMRDALAVSSDVYFYEVGGGFEDQRGLGITKIDKYLKMFGFSQSVSTPFFNGQAGTIPSPAWKAANFDGEAWTLGNTYHTAIGQYGFQVSPIQVVRAVAALATSGDIHEPVILKDEATVTSRVEANPAHYKIIREGMRQGVTTGIATALNVPYVTLAVKTGTAELGASKQQVNSWLTGFFPYDDPEYAFTILMEKGPVANTTGALYIMRQLIDWMNIYTPEYFN